MKLLTVIVPSYNVKNYLRQTLESMAGHENELEILIIDDGSTDGTSETANQLAAEYKNVRVIHQPNGGHGAALNTGIAEARGKYLRVVDGDDWLDGEALTKFLMRLKDEKADLVLSEHVENFEKSGERNVVKLYDSLPKNKLFLLENAKFGQFGVIMPNTTIRTKLLKNLGMKIDRHSYYVDQEYNLACYVVAKTITYYPLYLYQYRLERSGQSMDKKGLRRNILSHEKVCLRLITEYKRLKDKLSDKKREYIITKIIVPMCFMQYQIAIEYARSRKGFLSFDQKLSKYPEFYNHPGVAGKIIEIHRKTRGITVYLDPLLHAMGKFSR